MRARYGPAPLVLAIVLLPLLLAAAVSLPSRGDGLTVAIEWPYTDDIVAGLVNITGTATGAQWVEVSIDGGCWTQASGASRWNHIWNTTGQSGNHTVLARAVSGSNRSGAASVQVQVNNTPPTYLELTLDLSAREVDACQTFVASGLARFDTGVRIGENRVDITFNNGTYNTTTDRRGYYTLTLTAPAAPGQQKVRSLTTASGLTGSANAFIDVKMQNPPDLSIVTDDIHFSPAAPYGGQEVTVSAIVRNLGAGTATVRVRFSTAAASDVDETINVTGSWNATARWSLPSGTHNVTVKLLDISPWDSNATNNEASRVVKVYARPDLVLSDIVFSNSRPTAGLCITVQARVRNIGEREASGYVKFYDGPPATGTLLGQASVTVSPNATVMTFFQWTATRGNHTIFARISNVMPEEATDTNNEGSRALLVKPEPQPAPPPAEIPGFEAAVFTSVLLLSALQSLRKRETR